MTAENQKLSFLTIVICGCVANIVPGYRKQPWYGEISKAAKTY
jgi:hypothetical protein